MGFYAPAVLVKDAQRHGLRVRPIDVQQSDWPCTIEHEGAVSSGTEFVTNNVTNSQDLSLRTNRVPHNPALSKVAMGDRAEWVCPVLADVGMHEPLPRNRIVSGHDFQSCRYGSNEGGALAPEYNRVPHICPVLADVGFHESRLGNRIVSGHDFQSCRYGSNGERASAPEYNRVPHICPVLADVGMHEPLPRNRIVSGHDFQSCRYGSNGERALAPEYNRVPHICPVLADVGFHESRLGNRIVSGHDFQSCRYGSNGERASAPEYNRVPHICPVLADVGFHESRLGNRIVSGHDFQSCRYGSNEGGALAPEYRPAPDLPQPATCNLQPDPLPAPSSPLLALRLGLGYARGLRQQVGEAIVAARKNNGPFTSVDDLALRVPSLNKKEITLLANIGALNNVAGIGHRRDALWQVERAGKPEGPLLTHSGALLADPPDPSPLAQMTAEERLVADYAGTGLTTGRHPMSYRREELRPAKRPLRPGPPHPPRRRMGPRRRLRHRPPKTRNSQRLRLPLHGRRDRHRQHHRHAPDVRTEPGRRHPLALPVSRRPAPEPGQRHPRQSRPPNPPRRQVGRNPLPRLPLSLIKPEPEAHQVPQRGTAEKAPAFRPGDQGRKRERASAPGFCIRARLQSCRSANHHKCHPERSAADPIQRRTILPGAQSKDPPKLRDVIEPQLLMRGESVAQRPKNLKRCEIQALPSFLAFVRHHRVEMKHSCSDGIDKPPVLPSLTQQDDSPSALLTEDYGITLQRVLRNWFAERNVAYSVTDDEEIKIAKSANLIIGQCRTRGTQQIIDCRHIFGVVGGSGDRKPFPGPNKPGSRYIRCLEDRIDSLIIHINCCMKAKDRSLPERRCVYRFTPRKRSCDVTLSLRQKLCNVARTSDRIFSSAAGTNPIRVRHLLCPQEGSAQNRY
jgi:hypothetical protein